MRSQCTDVLCSVCRSFLSFFRTMRCLFRAGPIFNFCRRPSFFPFRRNPTASCGGRVSETFHKSGDRYIKYVFIPSRGMRSLSFSAFRKTEPVVRLYPFSFPFFVFGFSNICFTAFLMIEVSCFSAVRSAFVHISHLVSGVRLSGERSLFSSVIGPETQI